MYISCLLKGKITSVPLHLFYEQHPLTQANIYNIRKMDHKTMAQQLIFNLKSLNLNECNFGSLTDKDDLNKTFPAESSKFVPSTPSSAPCYNIELKKRRKQQIRITPYAPKSSYKARKSLTF